MHSYKTLPEPDRYFAGDTLVLKLTVVDADEDDEPPKDLIGADVEYELLEVLEGEVVLDHTDDDVSAEITNTSDGEITVEIDAGATDELDGTHTQILRIIDGDGKQNTYAGDLTIKSYN